MKLVTFLAGVLIGSSAFAQLGLPGASNPILPGYVADPTVVRAEGKFYIFATFDPWGFDTLSCWESVDFRNWTLRDLNWPTKKACTSPTSSGAKVWAPSVVKGADGKFYMYVSVGGEVWVGTAEKPTGPWVNALGDKPLVNRDFDRRYHMIDAECFIDEDGTAYLYWGSGLNYVNGHCFVVRLKGDMVTFDGVPQDVTPANYFEGPIILKHGGWYYLMSSNGKVGEHSYCVHVARSKSPMGPFEDDARGPILKTDLEGQVSGPGHNGLVKVEGVDYMVYHRNTWGKTGAYRQVCVDKITFDEKGWINPIKPTQDGARELWAALGVPSGGSESRQAAMTKTISWSASSSMAGYEAGKVGDDNYATRWAARGATDQKAGDEKMGGIWIQADLGSLQKVQWSRVRFEYPSRGVRFALEGSVDGKTWKVMGDYLDKGVQGSPVETAIEGEIRYLRIRFGDGTKPDGASIWEWSIG